MSVVGERRGVKIPSWDQLCRFKQTDFSDSQVTNQVENLATKSPRKLIWVARLIVKTLLRDPAYQKFLRFSWKEIVELIFDQAARNKEILKSGREQEAISDFASLRNSVKRPHNQLPCTPLTAQRRVEKALEVVDKSAKILVVGDDDLVGLELARSGFTNVTSIDICKEVCEYLRQTAKEEGLPLRILQHDLQNTPSQEYKETYELLFLDPIYSKYGLSLFIGGAYKFLEPGSLPKLFLSLHCMSLLKEGLAELESELRKYQLEVIDFYSSFNCYRIPGRLAWMIQFFNKKFLNAQYLKQTHYIWPFFLSDAMLLRKMR